MPITSLGLWDDNDEFPLTIPLWIPIGISLTASITTINRETFVQHQHPDVKTLYTKRPMYCMEARYVFHVHSEASKVC